MAPRYDDVKAYKRPDKTMLRVKNGMGGHEQDWVRACKGGQRASSHFDYSGPFAETVLMGNLAIRFPFRELQWDGAREQPNSIRGWQNWFWQGYPS